MKAADIATCNTLGRYGSGHETPMRLTNGQFYSPDGLRITAPDTWRPATQQQIETELRRQGAVAVQLGDAA